MARAWQSLALATCALHALTGLALVAACGLLLVQQEARGQYLDTETGCKLCHRTAIPNNDFCKLPSAEIWQTQDKHSRAFQLLHQGDTNDPEQARAKQELVRQILGFDLKEAFVDDSFARLKDGGDAETVRRVATVKACLRCHATWPHASDANNAQSPPVPLSLGVSCQACHGPSEKWDLPHRSDAWRLVTPEAKAELGFWDVRSTANKAKLCASCHVGDVSQDRFVKHEWYAGGHPPLPSFELASFEAQMPVHWNSLREKGEFAMRDGVPQNDGGQLENSIRQLVSAGVPREAIKGSYREANFPAAESQGAHPGADLARTRDAIVAGAAVMESYARVVGDYGRLAAEGKAAWPELALFDCAACHHELRNGLGLKYRPQRRTLPGRPPLANWPIPLARLATQQAANYAPAAADLHWSAVMEAFGKLEQAATSRPFGDPAAMRDAADPAADQLRQLANAAAATRYDEQAARQAIAFLAKSKFELNDFATARQIAWATRAIATDLSSPAAARLFLRDDGADAMALDLPSGSRSVMQNLGPWLGAASQHDPEWFRARLTAAAEQLAPPR